ncbi:proteasome assembly chaperone 4-like [Belonocnema kinseyi]|uniref:proteasome assembly chaperone 4-like n=1 Tax=Belonocnema kinseyi TaxID=2817044 RepID=UPI00143DE78F|nr:proteasome assembly chaperone 4-like [Belonocnema kinseyi]
MSSGVETGVEPCSFKFHEFMTQVGEIKVAGHILKMEDSLYLWVGEKSKDIMDDFSLAFPSKYESQPVVTKLLGPVADTTSNNIAKRLAKKFGKPVYVSFNLQADNLSLPGIEKSLHDELKKCLHLLAF